MVGSRSRLVGGDERIGMVVRTKVRANPLFVSSGHRVDFDGAVQAVFAGVRGYRSPEPTRLAHVYVNEERRKRLG
jgi:deoxyribonuclease V